jgi:hypothetical protein
MAVSGFFLKLSSVAVGQFVGTKCALGIFIGKPLAGENGTRM